MSSTTYAFLGQQAYVDAALRNTRLRLRAAVEVASGDEPPQFDAVASAEAETHAGARSCAAAGIAMPMLWLRDRLGLSATEELVIWVLLAHELDSTSRQLIRDLNTEQTVDPTLDAIRRSIYGSTTSLRAGTELAPEGVLRRLGLIERTDGDDRCPEHRQTFALARRTLMLALGDAAMDPGLSGIAAIPDSVPRCADLVVAMSAADRVLGAFSTSPGLIVVSGRPGTGRRSLLLAVAEDQGLSTLQLDARRISASRDVAARQLRLFGRECRLLGRTPLLCHLDALGGAGDVPDRIDLVETELGGLVLATTTRPLARRWRRPPTFVELPLPSSAERALLWGRAIPEASDGDTALMATMFPLAPSLIIAAGEVAHRQAGAQPLRPAHISAGVRSVLDDRLAGLATRLTITQTWDDLVVPADQHTALCELLARIRQRSKVYETWGFGDKVGKGLGVAALFSGPPGTGKTMAAGLVAKDLGVEVFQVDLSKIVSKWIGETERNLASLFDAAEAGHAILLFDEADSLFGRRTDVKSSNDRNANQETNFLLQRLESFTGICLLTTNHETSLDEAFRRRLSVHIRFPVPDIDERKHLWRAMLPKHAPTRGDLGIEQLADRFVMSGGYIRNAVLRAAFLAADSTGVIDARLLAQAATLEYEAIGKIVHSSTR